MREELAAMKEVANLNIKLEDVELELDAADLTDWWSDLANRLLDATRLLMSQAQVGHVDKILLIERDGHWPTLEEHLEAMHAMLLEEQGRFKMHLDEVNDLQQSRDQQS